MSDEVSSRQFPEITAAEAAELASLVKHPGWRIFLRRIRYTEAQELQRYLDTKSDEALAFFQGLKRAEKLVDWMMVEPKMARGIKVGDIPELPDESLTVEDMDRLHELGERDV